MKVLEVEGPRECDIKKNYWADVYNKFNGGKRNLIDWAIFLTTTKNKLKAVTENSWKTWFEECIKPGYQRQRMIFIDQVYCKEHVWLQEAINTNLTMLHKTLFIVSYKDSGLVGDRELKKLMEFAKRTNKTPEMKNFLEMQLGEDYEEETFVAN
jgi:hypothetical protein